MAQVMAMTREKRVIAITCADNVTLEQVRIRRGARGIANGGGIYNSPSAATLALRQCTLFDNHVTNDGPHHADAIDTGQPTTLTDCRIADNDASCTAPVRCSSRYSQPVVVQAQIDLT